MFIIINCYKHITNIKQLIFYFSIVYQILLLRFFDQVRYNSPFLQISKNKSSFRLQISTTSFQNHFLTVPIQIIPFPPPQIIHDSNKIEYNSQIQSMLSDLSVRRHKMTPIKSLLLQIMTPEQAEPFYQSKHKELQGNFIYIFNVSRKNLEWKINKRLVDFQQLAQRVSKKIGADFSNFGSEGGTAEDALFEKLEQYLTLCIKQGNSLAAIMLDFLEQSGHVYDGLQKYKEISMLKQSGGRYHESLFKCGNIFNSWKVRYFILHNEGIIYKDEYNNVKEYLSYDYDFSMAYGKIQTNDQLGIVLTSTHRKLKLKALNLFDWLQFIYYIKIGFNSCDYANINRYGSFAPIREKCSMKFYIDGENYFKDAAMNMLAAKKQVFITDWWLSPQLYLVRPVTSETEQFRLDKILEKIAKRGVKVMIIVYHQSTFLLNDSLYTKTYLESLHSNIKVLRHPQTVLPMLWSHHEKMIVIDQTYGYLGGLDLCYGRWDTQQHKLFDTDKKMFPGIEYNNIRAQDISNVREFDKDQYDREKPRMPWHDIACYVQGEAVWDLSRHFIQYWNYASFQIEVNDRQILMRNPYKKPNKFKKKIGEGLEKIMDMSKRIRQKINGRSPQKPPNRIQAYLDDKALNQSYIEVNQNTQQEGQSYHLQIQTPTHIRLSSTLQVPGARQSISRHIIDPYATRKSQIQQNAARIDNRFMNLLSRIKEPEQEDRDKENDEFSFKDLITEKNAHKIYSEQIKQKQKPIAYKQLETSKSGSMECQILRSVGSWSIGCSKQSTQCSIQVAYVQLIANSKNYIYIENQFFMSSCADSSIIKNQIANAIALRIRKASQKGQKFRVYVVLPLLPGFAGEVDDPQSKILKLQMHWQYQTINRGKNSLLEQLNKFVPFPEKYIRFVGLRTHDRLSDSHQPKTEIVYVHSKMMIIDDEYVILGSANINDRSMKGKRDSEVCIVARDTSRLNTLINGEMVEVSHSCSILRKQLFKQHFGFITESELDPLLDYNWNLLGDIISQNTDIYREVFACYPDNAIKKLSDLADFRSKGNLDKYEELKDLIRGNVVEFPLGFLEQQNLNLRVTQKQYLIPASFAT